MRRERRRCLTTSELIKKYKIGSNTFFLEVTERDKITNCIFARAICVRSLIKKKKGKKRRYSNCRYVLKSLICRTNIQTREKIVSKLLVSERSAKRKTKMIPSKFDHSMTTRKQSEVRFKDNYSKRRREYFT